MSKGIWSTRFSFPTEEAHELFDHMCEEFDDLSECIWKLNDQIGNIWTTELEKVAATSDPVFALSRFVQEKRNVERTFPLLLNYSFLATAFALYERHLYRLCDLVQKFRELPVGYGDLKGNGVGRAFTYLEKFCGIYRAQLPNYDAVDTMRLVRNCIVHDAGYLDGQNLSKAQEIENRIKNGNYLSVSHRHLKEKCLKIRDPDGLPRLWFGLDYAFIIPSYCREFFKDVFVAVSLAQKSEGPMNVAGI